MKLNQKCSIALIFKIFFILYSQNLYAEAQLTEIFQKPITLKKFEVTVQAPALVSSSHFYNQVLADCQETLLNYQQLQISRSELDRERLIKNKKIPLAIMMKDQYEIWLSLKAVSNQLDLYSWKILNPVKLTVSQESEGNENILYLAHENKIELMGAKVLYENGQTYLQIFDREIICSLMSRFEIDLQANVVYQFQEPMSHLNKTKIENLFNYLDEAMSKSDSTLEQAAWLGYFYTKFKKSENENLDQNEFETILDLTFNLDENYNHIHIKKFKDLQKWPNRNKKLILPMSLVPDRASNERVF